MQTSPNGIAFIQRNEGLTLKVKGDTGEKQVVGYGHDLLPEESYPGGISIEDAEILLRADVAKVDAAMNAQHLALDLNQNQWDAIADFTYECGPAALIQLLAHGIDQIPVQLPRWVWAKVKGKETKLPGMIARRQAEIALFNTP